MHKQDLKRMAEAYEDVFTYHNDEIRILCELRIFCEDISGDTNSKLETIFREIFK